MNLLEKMGLEKENFQNYESVDAQRQDAWNNGLSSVEKELKNEAASYISEERTRSAKIAELSRIKMLG
jgi:hypothetical protein